MIQSQSEKGLSSFCKSQSSFKTRLGIFSLYQARFSNWFEILLLSIEYLQLLSLTILIHPTVSQISTEANKGPFVFELIAYLLKTVNPSYLLSFTQNDSTTNVVLAIILGYIVFKYIMLSYVIYVSWFNKESNNFLKSLWRWIFKLQGRITCCFIISFWVRTIVMTSNNSFSIQGINNRALIAISAAFIILEYLTSLMLETQLCDFMPSKKYLASKNYEMQIITLLQKLFIQFIHLFAYQDPKASVWICIVLNLVVSFFREYRFFTTLPLYKFKSLLYQGDLSAIALSLHFAHFFQQILRSSDYSKEIDFRFTIILWVIFGIMSCRLSRTSVKQIYTQLLTSYHPKENPNILLHKIFATKYLIKNTKIPSDQTEKLDIKYLLGITQTLNLPQVFNLNLESKQISHDMVMNEKGDETRIILEYLGNLSDQFPTNSLIKLNLAYQSYKSTKFHSKIIKITSELNENILSPYQISAALLLYDLEIKNLETSAEEEEKKNLDLIRFLENKMFMQDVESEILKQISLRKEICENIVGEKPDLETIYQNSQIAYSSKLLIQKKISSFLKRAPEYYIDPLLVFAEHSLYLNYSIEDYYNYYENYSRKLSRFTKEFDINQFSQENLYQIENAFLIISAENNCIVYSTKSLQNICGLDKNNYKGTPITRLFPYCLQDYYNKIIKEIFEKGHTEFTNKSIKIFLSHKEGWLIEADIFIRVHPYMSQNLYLDMLIRPHNELNNIILLNDTGNIQGATQNINQLIQFNKSAKNSLHIKQISEDLADLNNAFNIINCQPEKIIKSSSGSSSPANFKISVASTETPFLDHEKAQEIYNLYTEEQKVIELPNSQNFHCKISKLDFNTFSLNLLHLESVSHKSSRNYIENSLRYDASLQTLDDLKYVDHLPLPLTTKDFPATHRMSTYLPTTQEPGHETEENLVISPSSSRMLLKNNLLQIPPQRPQKLLNPTLRASLAGARTISVGTSKISQISGMFKAFHRAISTRSHQRSFNFLCLIFYGVILGTLICQIVLKSALDTTMSNLMIKTDLLNFAQRRTLQVCAIHNVARGCALIIDGLLTPASMNLADTPLRSNLANMILPEEVLTWSNEGIINNIASESDAIQQMLFEKDVLIKGIIADPLDSKTEFITHFQHSDLLRNALKLLNGLPLVASTAGANAFDFLTFNSANSFLVKNNKIIDAFQASVDKQKEDLQVMINLSVVVLPILLTGIVCLLAVIIYKQYTKEKRHLLAFLKLNPKSIKHILENLIQFEKRLIQQEKLSDKLIPKLIYRLEHDPQVTSYHKGHDAQVVIYGRMQKRYSLYILKVLLYISLLIAIVIINYASITNAIDGIYRQQRQIQYANDISSTAAITYISFAEMFVTNNTNYINGQPPFESFKNGRKRIGEIQATFYKEFQLENGDFDPDVKKILFEEMDCNRFVASAYDNCISIKSLNLPSNMAATITLYKNMLETKLASFLAVNRTSIGAMIGAALTKLSYILAPYRVTSAEAELISEILSEKLIYRIDDIYSLGTTILTVFSVTLLIVSFLVWFQILTKVKRVNNDFKKVLAVLPPNIILSSFLLKTFLNKTSNIPQKL